MLVIRGSEQLRGASREKRESRETGKAVDVKCCAIDMRHVCIDGWPLNERSGERHWLADMAR